MRLPKFAFSASAVACGFGPALAADQCLSTAEVNQAARMFSIMAAGSELRRCGACLDPDRYVRSVHNYENGLLSDFFNAKDSFKGQEKIDYADQLVRDAARKATSSFSAECRECTKLADTVDGLTSTEARAKYYEQQAADLAKSAAVKSCP